MVKVHANSNKDSYEAFDRLVLLLVPLLKNITVGWVVETIRKLTWSSRASQRSTS